jgi:hypothetical protein
MFKMKLHDPFGFLKHKLWPKEGFKVKLLIWLSTTKSQESPWFLACKWHATYPWKSLNQGYNFVLNLTSIEGMHTKLWASKVTRVPILGISGLPLMSLGTKWHSGAGLVARWKEYYKGEGGDFVQVRAMVSFVSPCLLVARPCTKSVSIMH